MNHIAEKQRKRYSSGEISEAQLREILANLGLDLGEIEEQILLAKIERGQ